MATFYIEAVEATTITLKKVGSPTVGTAKYGINNTSVPNSYTYGTSISLTAGKKCYFTITKTTTNFTASKYINFTSTGKINVGGNLSDLIGGSTSIPRDYCFHYLFYDCEVIDASKLVLVSDLNNKNYVYSYMFCACILLTQAPELLPATTLTSNCYYQMFQMCESLTQAPQLPATTLADNCYYGMFRDCKSLTQAPELPATILADNCYRFMFYRCTSLTQVPELPATTLADSCYYYMFNGCTSIKLSETQSGNYLIPYRIPTEGTGVTASNALNDMFTSTGGTFKGTPTINTTYYLYSDLDPTTRDYLFFEAVEDTAIKFSINGTLTNTPVIYYSLDKATWTQYTFGSDINLTLGQKCYWKGDNYSFSNYNSNYINFQSSGNVKASGNVMSLVDSTCISTTIPISYCFNSLFKNCASLTQAPELPATTLANDCYESMFQNCTSLTQAPELPATTLKNYCYQNMFHGCTSLTQAPELPATTLADDCYSEMFQGCTSLTIPPELPATTLKKDCYYYMFFGCTSLTQAPELPATTLKNYCYYYMFYGCTSLTQAPELPATTLADRCYSAMFRGCTSLTMPPELPATTLADNCYEYMFYGCTSLKLYETQSGNYLIPYRIPTEGTGVTASNALNDMFTSTGGTFKGTPTINTTYYLSDGTYYISLDYDETLGSATFSRDSINRNIITLTATALYTSFKGWYVNDELLSYQNPFTLTLEEDIEVYADFEPIYEITNETGSGGYLQYERAAYVNDVTFTVVTNEHMHFVKYIVNDIEYETTPLTIRLTEDITISAVFEQDTQVKINVKSNVNGISVYVENDEVYPGEEVTLFARPYPNYIFIKWSDGNKDNPRTITVNQSITLIAEYQRVMDTNAIYHYRCFVKDQLHLTDFPKSFMMVSEFDIKEDLLTTSNSTITVYDVDKSIENGDILVLYDPFGNFIYKGVIYSIEENVINCHQIQNFLQGLWIYNTNPQEYLEDELYLLIKDYMDGKIYGSTYVDPLIAERLGGFTLQKVSATTNKLPTDVDDEGNPNYTQKEMESFIYSLYQDYGIILDFEINYSGPNYITIKTPSYSSIKIGNNVYAINNLSPKTEIEETNKLIIMNNDKTYNSTYIATGTEILKEPSSIQDRFKIVNTKVVTKGEEDEIEDIIAKNLPNVMYNHKITFSLILNNSLYSLNELNLGMPLDIWNGNDYYYSVLTSWEMRKEINKNPSYLDIICGKVRSSLTKKLSLEVFK